MKASDSAFEMLRNNLSQFVSLTDEELGETGTYFYPRKFKKREQWLKQGEICTEVIFIVKGCMRLHHINDGTDRSLEFFFENSWFTDFQSILTKQPAVSGMEALEDTEVLAIRFRDLTEIYDKYPSCQRIGRLIAENTVIHVCNLYNNLLIYSPQERYLKLLEEKSQIIDRVPQHLIASYIGVEPETLSRIRKKIMYSQTV